MRSLLCFHARNMYIAVDVIKTRYLADVTKQYTSIPDCIVKLYRAEGVKGFFKVCVHCGRLLADIASAMHSHVQYSGRLFRCLYVV